MTGTDPARRMYPGHTEHAAGCRVSSSGGSDDHTPTLGRTIAVVAAAFLALLIAAPAALAKEGIETRLAAPISGDAQPGDIVPVYFTGERDQRDRMTPLYGTNIFFRLYGPDRCDDGGDGGRAVDARTLQGHRSRSRPAAPPRASSGSMGRPPTARPTWSGPTTGRLSRPATPPAVDPNAFQLPEAALRAGDAR